MAQTRYLSLVPSITVPMRRVNMGRPSQSRQRCVMVLCLMFDWTLKEPQCGQ